MHQLLQNARPRNRHSLKLKDHHHNDRSVLRLVGEALFSLPAEKRDMGWYVTHGITMALEKGPRLFQRITTVESSFANRSCCFVHGSKSTTHLLPPPRRLSNLTPSPSPRCSRNAFDQPSMLLSPSTHFNPEKPSRIRNPVPVAVPRDDEESLSWKVVDRFNGVSIEGTSILTPPPGSSSPDERFAGCAQGASPLVNMSDFLLERAGVEEEGASR